MSSSGIYKITSPSKKIYIGETVNFEKRFKRYNRLECKRQFKLYNSFLKYGVENHIFEIIEECDITELKCRERYWQDYYDVISEKGMNLNLTSCGDKKREWSKEVHNKMVNKLKEGYASGRIINHFKDKKHSEKVKEKMRKINKKGSNPNSKVVIDIETGIYYDCASELAELLQMNKSTLWSILKRNNPNTKYKYC